MVQPDYILNRRGPRYGLIFAVWTILGVVDASQFYIWGTFFSNKPVFWYEALLSGLADWYGWAVLAPFIFAFARRYPLEHNSWGRHLFAHLAAATSFMLLKVTLDVPLVWLIHGDFGVPPDKTLQETFLYYVANKFLVYYLIYGLIVTASQLLDLYHRFRERELAASQLEARLAQAQLQVLKMQLHPHFLFNTLNAVSALMHRDVNLADRMIARLGGLLRATLEMSGTQEVTVQQELEFIRPYLEIEQARLGTRLGVRFEIATESLDARLPSLLLQPLVENSIRHGIVPRSGPGHITIRAQRVGDRLQVQVADNGPGIPNGPEDVFKSGIGLSNTRARLHGLYGDEQSFRLANAPGGGLVVTVTLPFCEDGVPADADEPAELAPPATPHRV